MHTPPISPSPPLAQNAARGEYTALSAAASLSSQNFHPATAAWNNVALMPARLEFAAVLCLCVAAVVCLLLMLRNDGSAGSGSGSTAAVGQRAAAARTGGGSSSFARSGKYAL
jgi:hypothetical protein